MRGEPPDIAMGRKAFVSWMRGHVYARLLHDLRNNLSIVSVNVEALAPLVRDPEGVAIMADIEEGSRRAVGLLDALGRLSR